MIINQHKIPYQNKSINKGCTMQQQQKVDCKSFSYVLFDFYSSEERS